MHILIVKDSATKVPREVKDIDEARAFALQGFPVLVIGEDGTESPLGAEPPKEVAPVKAAAKKAPAKKTKR